MNLFDTIVLVGALVGLLFGIMGKATKRICSLLYTVLALIIAYFACGTLVSGVMGISVNAEQTLEAYLIATLSEVTAEFNMPMATIIGLVEGIVKLLAFYILFFIVNFVVNLIGKIVVGKSIAVATGSLYRLVERRKLISALEHQMLQQVSKPGKLVRLVLRTHAVKHIHVNHLGAAVAKKDDTQPILKTKTLYFHHSSSITTRLITTSFTGRL